MLQVNITNNLYITALLINLRYDIININIKKQKGNEIIFIHLNF